MYLNVTSGVVIVWSLVLNSNANVLMRLSCLGYRFAFSFIMREGLQALRLFWGDTKQFCFFPSLLDNAVLCVVQKHCRGWRKESVDVQEKPSNCPSQDWEMP